MKRYNHIRGGFFTGNEVHGIASDIYIYIYANINKYLFCKFEYSH